MMNNEINLHVLFRAPVSRLERFGEIQAGRSIIKCKISRSDDPPREEKDQGNTIHTNLVGYGMLKDGR
jgi:hypothetical protein